MKTKLLTLVALTLLLTANSNSQTTSGGAVSGGGGVQVNPGSPPVPRNGTQPSDNIRRRELLSPTANAPADGSGNINAQSSAGANQIQSGTNQFVVGGNTNLLGASTNELAGGATNQSELTPTSRPGATNRVFSTNSLSVSNTTMIQDQALTQVDQQLIVQIRQTVSQIIPTRGAWSPVHFIARNGVVTVVGTVTTVEERNRIITSVQQIPGVAGIENQLTVGTQGSAGGAAATSEAVGATGAAVGTSSTTDTSVQRGVTTTTSQTGPADNKVNTGFTTQTSPYTTRPSGFYTSGVSTATAATNQSVPGQPLPGGGAAVAPTSNPNMTNRIYNNGVGTEVNPAPGQPPAIPGQPR